MNYDLDRRMYDTDENGGGGSTATTFTQEQLNEIVTTRLAKEKAKHDTKIKEVLGKLGIENEDKIEEVVGTLAKYKDLEVKYNEQSANLAKKDRFEKISKAGVDADFVEFVDAKLKGSEQFDEALVNFVTENPKYTKEVFAKVNSSIELGERNKVDLSKMTTEEYLAWRAKNKL